MNLDSPLTNFRSAPIIETDRLRLRPHQLADMEDCFAMWADPEIARFTIGEPSTYARTWARLLAYSGHWALLGFGYWAIEEKKTLRFIGEMGFADFKRGVHPAVERMPEAGWVLAKHAHGRGYCSEGLRAVIAWSDDNLDGRSIVCLIKNDNNPSLRVANRLGFIATPPLPNSESTTTTVFVRAPITPNFIKFD